MKDSWQRLEYASLTPLKIIGDLMGKKEDWVGNYPIQVEQLDQAQVESSVGSRVVQIRSATTRGAVKAVKKLVNDGKIGKVISVAHCRNESEIPLTIFLGDKGLILESGGLGSGYGGEGPRGLETLLKEYNLKYPEDWLLGTKSERTGCKLFEK